MVRLNRNVVTAVASWPTISEEPLKQLSPITAHFNFGFVKDSVPLRRKIDQPGNRGDQIAEACPQSSAPDAQVTGDNENVIQNDIRATPARTDSPKPRPGFPAVTNRFENSVCKILAGMNRNSTMR